MRIEDKILQLGSDVSHMINIIVFDKIRITRENKSSTQKLLKTFVSYHAHEISSEFKVLKSRKEMKVSVFEALTYFGSSNTRNYKKAFNKMESH